MHILLRSVRRDSRRSVNMEARSRPTIPLLDWPEVKKIIEDGKLDLLGRSDSQQAEYDTFRHSLNKEWNSVGDYILVSKFGISTGVDSGSGKLIARRDEISEDRIVLLPNDFPYNFVEGIHHLILWKIGSSLTAGEIDEYIEKVKSDSRGITDLAMYVNPPALKSIPDIDHAHILYYV